MKQILLGVIGVLVTFSMPIILAMDAIADISWGNNSIKVISRKSLNEDSPKGSYPCMGNLRSIEVQNEGNKDEVCVFGSTSQFRMARSFNDARYEYFIAFPYQSTFYELKGACPRAGCVYSPANDLFLTHEQLSLSRYAAVLYNDFSKHLKKTTDPNTQETFYEFTPDSILMYPLRVGEVQIPVESMNFSNNGKWALLETRNYGIVRLNTESYEVRRVIPGGVTYGLLSDPYYELAITNDGRYMATTGFRAKTAVYEIDADCGDTLGDEFVYSFDQGVTRCNQFSFDTATTFPDMSFGYNLKFSPEGDTLGLSIAYRHGGLERVMLTSTDIEGVVDYLALGDSFTSGEGELSDEFYVKDSNEAMLKCHVSSRSYPYLVATRWGVRAENIACSGARTVDIHGVADYMGQNGVLELETGKQRELRKSESLRAFKSGVLLQSQFVSYYQPTIVSLGIGGNDAGLVGKLTGCLGVGDCEWVSSSAKVAATAREILDVYPKIREVLSNLKLLSPASRYFVVGYPNIINNKRDAPCSPLIGKLLSHTERKFISESISYLNEVVKSAAKAEGVVFVDTYNRFDNHFVCGNTDSVMMNDVRLGDDIGLMKPLDSMYMFGSESFHPTPKGHKSIADAILTTFNTPSEIIECDDCDDNVSIPAPPSYWRYSPNDTFARQFEDAGMSGSVYGISEKIVVRSKSGLFLPNSEVVAELHSQPIVLSKGLSSEDGSYAFEGTIPVGVVPGYHALHLLGTAPDGSLVDVYKTVVVKEGVSSLSMNTDSEGLNGYDATTTISNPESKKHDLNILTLLSDPVSVMGAQSTVSRIGIVKDSNAGIYQDEAMARLLFIASMVGIAIIVVTWWALFKVKSIHNSLDPGG